MSALVIANTQIRRDGIGRYCLNDLHQASGGAGRHKPDNWLRSQQAQELVAEIEKSLLESENPLLRSEKPLLESENPDPALVVISGGFGAGTYAVKELVYGYAMWISAAFHLHVIRAYDALVQGQQQAASTPRLPEAPPHRADVMVAATRSFAALVRAGRTLRMSHARAVQAANAATYRATGVDLVQELDAADLVAERRPARLPGPLTDWAPAAEIERFVDGRDEVSVAQVLQECLGVSPDDRQMGLKVGTVMAAMGWSRHRRRNRPGEPGGQFGTYYLRPGAARADDVNRVATTH